jgi:hypothetical protein
MEVLSAGWKDQAHRNIVTLDVGSGKVSYQQGDCCIIITMNDEKCNFELQRAEYLPASFITVRLAKLHSVFNCLRCQMLRLTHPHIHESCRLHLHRSPLHADQKFDALYGPVLARKQRRLLLCCRRALLMIDKYVTTLPNPLRKVRAAFVARMSSIVCSAFELVGSSPSPALSSHDRHKRPRQIEDDR